MSGFYISPAITIFYEDACVFIPDANLQKVRPTYCQRYDAQLISANASYCSLEPMTRFLDLSVVANSLSIYLPEENIRVIWADT